MCEAGGADIFSVINTLLGMAVDAESWKTKITNNKGGISGPAIKPIALQMVNAVYTNCKLPIIGIGGIMNTNDVVEFLLCGATAVQIGTGLFIDPEAPIKIEKGLRQYLKRKNLNSVRELVGQVRKY